MIVVAAVTGGKWVGLGVFVAASAVAVGWWLHARRDERVTKTVARPHAPGERRILVIANETVAGHTLRSMILEKSLDVREEVLVVTPALNSPLKHWVSDDDGARAEAQDRLDRSLEQLADAGVQARGEIGDGDPLQAIEDALRTSARMRSSSRRIQKDARPGSSGASWTRHASASRSRSRTWLWT